MKEVKLFFTFSCYGQYDFILFLFYRYKSCKYFAGLVKRRCYYHGYSLPKIIGHHYSSKLCADQNLIKNKCSNDTKHHPICYRSKQTSSILFTTYLSITTAMNHFRQPIEGGWYKQRNCIRLLRQSLPYHTLLTSNKMDSKLFSIALAVILCLSLGTAAPQTQNNNNCPSNSEWRYGNECTDSCEADKICPMTNEYGCFCIEGHSRIDGECFPSQFCNCGLNREFRSCASLCDHMCPTDEELICPAICLMECSCKAGLIDVDGECLPRDEVCVEQ